MRYKLTINFVSKYGETDPADIVEMINKIAHWSKLIQNENNSSNRHLGLHAVITSTKVEKIS